MTSGVCVFTMYVCISRIVKSVRAFLHRIYDPETGSGAVDVYAMMFACQFIIFIIILFSWSAFSSPEVRQMPLKRGMGGKGLGKGRERYVAGAGAGGEDAGKDRRKRMGGNETRKE